MAKTTLPLTISLSENLKIYIDARKGSCPFFKKTLIKPTQLIEKALEQYFKDNGHWEHYQEFCASQESETY